MANPNALPKGFRIGEYVIDTALGWGGFGITYLAQDLNLNHLVAIKEFFPNSICQRNSSYFVEQRRDADAATLDWGMQKFITEAELLASIKHRNVVGVNKLMRANGTAYMVLDYINGPSMRQWIDSLDHPVSQAQLDALVPPILNALEVVHGCGLLHRDIAPKNIMIDPPFSPVLIDFGAARQLVAVKSHTFAAMLTRGYAPFEQYMTTTNEQGPWTDIYSISATIYEAISGTLPPEATERALDDTCPPAVEMGSGRYRQGFLEALDWGLRPLPKHRPRSIEKFRESLFSESELKPLSASPDQLAVDPQKFSPNSNNSWNRISEWFMKLKTGSQ